MRVNRDNVIFPTVIIVALIIIYDESLETTGTVGEKGKIARHKDILYVPGSMISADTLRRYRGRFGKEAHILVEHGAVGQPDQIHAFILIGPGGKNPFNRIIRRGGVLGHFHEFIWIGGLDYMQAFVVEGTVYQCADNADITGAAGDIIQVVAVPDIISIRQNRSGFVSDIDRFDTIIAIRHKSEIAFDIDLPGIVDIGPGNLSDQNRRGGI